MKKIYLNEYNIPTNNSIYLPFSSGLLQAYAQQFSQITDNYEFVKIFFQRDTVENIVSQYDNPDVVGFSVSIWNFQLSLAVAEELKKKFPNCCIIFGGPSAPHKSSNFFKKYPFVDLIVYRDGEIPFVKILRDRLKNGLILHQIIQDDNPSKDLDVFLSPYSTGIFDQLLRTYPELEFKVLMETNRNCPFACAFCFYGNDKISNKIRYHSLEYTQQEIDWISSHRINYVTCADANFGMFARDTEIAQMFSNGKAKYGYPDKIRINYGKNTTEHIFNAAKILSEADLAKTVTLSVQSFDEHVLDSIKRRNIKTTAFEELRKKYNNAGIPTYTEMILGLPNETKQSFIDGLESAIRLVGNNQIFVYHCQILPNTLLDNPDYQQQYGIETITIPLAEVHITARQENFTQEFDEIVIKTNTLTTEDWLDCTVLFWIVQLFHSLKIGNEIIHELVQRYDIDYMNIYTYISQSDILEIQNFHQAAQAILQGTPRCRMDKRFSNIYFEMEEFAYLNILCDKERFFGQLYDTLYDFLVNEELDTDPNMTEIFNYQMSLLPDPNDFSSTQEFAIQTVLYGRKSNKLVKK